MGLQTWVQLLNEPTPTADATALASSSSLTDVSPSPPLVIPANFFYPGASLRITAAGEFSTTGTPTLLIGAYVGGVAGTALAVSAATTTQSGASHQTWRLVIEATARSIGASGTILGIGTLVGVGTSPLLIPATTPGTIAINTTIANSLTIGAQWGTSSASNTLTVKSFFVEALN